jgi:hypothetical protein
MASQDALSSRPLGARQDSQPSQEDQDLDDRDDDDRNSPEPKKRPAGRALLPRLDFKSQRPRHDDGMSLTVPEAIASECHTHTVPPIAIEGGARPSRSRGRSLSLTLFERTCFPPFAIEGAISVPHTVRTHMFPALRDRGGDLCPSHTTLLGAPLAIARVRQTHDEPPQNVMQIRKIPPRLCSNSFKATTRSRWHQTWLWL